MALSARMSSPGRPLAVLSLLVLFLAAGSAPAATPVHVWLTTGDQTNLLAHKPDLSFSSGSGPSVTSVTVNAAQTYQTMSGFGAALTDAAAYDIQHDLTTAQRNAVMSSLFSPTSGIGISYLRLPMGACDYAKTAYTYDDVPAGQTDPTLSNFTIAHDLAYIVPELKQALSLNPKLQIMASPWSPPAWMKTTDTLNGGSLNPAYYQAYANYFVNFVQAYQAQGIGISAVTVQNEPENSTTSYPSMSLSATAEANFIGNYLGPAFAAAGLKTQIFAYDHNWDDTAYPTTVLNNPQANQYIAGTAWHAYAGSPPAQSVVHNAFPSKGTYFTEISGGTWATNFASNLTWNYHNIFLGAPQNWAQTALLWNLALDQNNGPTIGGAANCRGVVTINSLTGAVTDNVEYYAIGQSSEFVKPGALRIGSTSLSNILETVAYKNPDGSEVLLALNPASTPLTFKVSENSRFVTYTLPGQSVVTLSWQGVPEPSSVGLLLVGLLAFCTRAIWRRGTAAGTGQ
jgi:glucosylceramidase